MTNIFLIRFVQYKEEFRLDEWKSLCKLFNVKYAAETEYKIDCPFWIVHLPGGVASAEQILFRAILIREITELIAVADKFADLVKNTRADLGSSTPFNYEPYGESSFFFDVDDYMGKIAHEEQVDMINSFSFLPLRGPVKIKNADVTFMIHCDKVSGTHYFGRLLKSGQRELIKKFNLKKREYLGTTSMDPELSLIMSNLGLVKPDSLVYDPFVGTGSFLCTTSIFGAYSLGSDIDGRQMRGGVGVAQGKNMFSNLEQYGLANRVIGGMVFDILHHPWRMGLQFDAIITDPPYGVRAGAKKIGTKSCYPISCSALLSPEEKASRYPKTIPYEMDELVVDLYAFSNQFLALGGRMVFWYPVEFAADGSRVSRSEVEAQLPTHPNLVRVAVIPQFCRLFDRWLIVLEKI